MGNRPRVIEKIYLLLPILPITFCRVSPNVVLVRPPLLIPFPLDFLQKKNLSQFQNTKYSSLKILSRKKFRAPAPPEKLVRSLRLGKIVFFKTKIDELVKSPSCLIFAFHRESKGLIFDSNSLFGIVSILGRQLCVKGNCAQDWVCLGAFSGGIRGIFGVEVGRGCLQRFDEDRREESRPGGISPSIALPRSISDPADLLTHPPIN